MSKKKIAICLSGKSKFWQDCVENFYDFFDENLADYRIFLHTWKDANSDDDEIIKSSFMSYFSNIEEIKIDDPGTIFAKKLHLDPSSADLAIPSDRIITGLEKAVFRKYPSAWYMSFYEIMMPNFMKRKYELENNMQFDIVVSTKLNNAYSQNGDKFTRYLEHIMHREIYANTMICKDNYGLPGVDMNFHYGNSETMDVVDCFYNAYQSSDFFRMMHSNGRDPGYKLLGPRVLFHKWMMQKNITIKPSQYRVTTLSIDAEQNDKSNPVDF